jgi:hypothetical protein
LKFYPERCRLPPIPIGVEERRSHDPVLTRPSDRESGLGVFDTDRIRVLIAGPANSEVLGKVEHLGTAGVTGEQHRRASARNFAFRNLTLLDHQSPTQSEMQDSQENKFD